jgi:hypothetical protein
MKVWRVLCLVSFLSDGQAALIDVRTEEDTTAGGAVTVSRSESSPSEGKKVDHPGQEEKNNPDPIIIDVSEKLSSSGGGLRLLDPKLGDPTLLFPLSEEAPWWEQWWTAICEWFSRGS